MPALRRAAHGDGRAYTAACLEVFEALKRQDAALRKRDEEARRSRAALESTRDEFDRMVHFASLAHLVLDSNRMVLRANLAACAMFETDLRVLQESDFVDFVAPASRAAFQRHCGMALDGERHTAELNLQRAGEQDFRARVITYRVAESRLGIRGLRFTITDISAQQRAGEALLASEERYRHLFEHASTCMFIVDLRLLRATIVEANRSASRTYGYSDTELRGMPMNELVPVDARPDILAITQRLRDGTGRTTETTHRRRDGTVFPVRVMSTLDPSDPQRIVIAVEDISLERQRHGEATMIELERRRIAHEIHDGVAQGLAALRFRSSLWHELADNNVAGMHDALDALQMELVGAIDNIRRVIFALRPLELDTLAFFPALTDWINAFGTQNGLVIHLETSGPLDTFDAAYELPLFRIIQQALDNVRQHAHASATLVRLAVSDGGAVTLIVRDDGRGFDSGRPLAAGKLGHFGLRQMRERIDELAGTFEIQSAAGRGTELLIRLPPPAGAVYADHGRRAAALRRQDV